jgi:glycerol-3-phosphate acyltransferase PlsY
VGCIPNGLWVGRIVKGIDVREFGSKNIGATNVGRTIGWRYGFLVLILDMAKGIIPVLFFPVLDEGSSLFREPISVDLIYGVLAILGHVFNPFLGLKGGKGVATALGVYLALVPIPSLISILVFGLVYRLSGFVSLGSMIASIFLPLVYWFVSYLDSDTSFHFGIFLSLCMVVLLILYSHRENLKRILSGKELPAVTEPQKESPNR